MTVVKFHIGNDNTAENVSLEPNENLLEALLKSGHDVPFGCKSGICQSCIMKCDSGTPPPLSQQGLKPSQIAQGYFLACQCKPDSPMTFTRPSVLSNAVSSKVIEKSALNDGIFRLRIEKTLDYQAGQFLTLWGNEKIARSYSCSSVPNLDEHIEFQIKRIEGGAFSSWAWESLQVGDEIKVQGPLGNCFYTDDLRSDELFLSGIGTGLAPLLGILRDALHQQHQGQIHLYIGAKISDNFYYLDNLKSLAAQHTNINLRLISQEPSDNLASDDVFSVGDIYQTVKSEIPDFKNIKVFLCGAESFVRKMKKQCFLSGANMKDIAADPFIAFGS